MRLWCWWPFLFWVYTFVQLVAKATGCMQNSFQTNTFVQLAEHASPSLITLVKTATLAWERLLERLTGSEEKRLAGMSKRVVSEFLYLFSSAVPFFAITLYPSLPVSYTISPWEQKTMNPNLSWDGVKDEVEVLFNANRPLDFIKAEIHRRHRYLGW